VRVLKNTLNIFANTAIRASGREVRAVAF
jgi:hypothetical protein